MMEELGTLCVVGLGPGDPELMTLKAARIIAAAPVIAYFTGRGKPGRARAIAGKLIHPAVEELRLEYPFTTEVPVADPAYTAELEAFYEVSAAAIANRLEARRDVALLCAGDPFFYGSSLAMLDRLVGHYPHEVVPGVPGMSGCWASAGLPIVHGDDVLSVLPGTLEEDALADRLAACDAAVIMKVGRNLGKIRVALTRAALLDRAVYVENGTTACERIMPLAQMTEATAPYFSLVLVPGRQRRR